MVVIILVILGAFWLVKENPKLKKTIAYITLGFVAITILLTVFGLTTSQKSIESNVTENVVVADIKNNQHAKQQFTP